MYTPKEINDETKRKRYTISPVPDVDFKNPVFCSSDLNIPNQGSVVAPRGTCDAPHVFEVFLSLAPTSLKTKVFAPQQFSVSITHFLRTKR